MNKELSESIFKEAVIKACEMENNSYDKMIEKEPEPEYTLGFKEKIMKLYEDSENEEEEKVVDYPAGRISKLSLRVKIALIAIIIMLFGSMTVAGIDPMHEMTFKMFEVSHPDHTDITFGEEGGSSLEFNVNDEIHTFDPADFLKRLTWVPEGFKIESEYIILEMCLLIQSFTYTDAKGEWHQIDYSQDTVEYCGNIGFSSNGEPGKEIDICGNEGRWYTDEGGYRKIIMEKDGFMYYISGNVEIEVLKRCLESAFEEETDAGGGTLLAANYEATDFPKHLTWVPKEYTLDKKEEYPDWAAYEYHKENTLYDHIRYEEVKIDQDTWKLEESVKNVEEITVGKDKAYLLTQDEGEFPEIQLAKDGIWHRISGDAEVEDMIRCLESALEAAAEE